MLGAISLGVEAQTLTGLFRILQPPDKTKTILRARARQVRPAVVVGGDQSLLQDFHDCSGGGDPGGVL